MVGDPGKPPSSIEFSSYSARQAMIDDLAETLNKILAELMANIGADIVTSLLYDAERDTFEMPLGYGLKDPATFRDLRLRPRPDYGVGTIIKTRKSLIVNSTDNHPILNGPFARREDVKAVAGLPISTARNMLGILFVSFRQAHSFTEEELNIIERATRDAADVIHNTEVIKLLQYNSLADTSKDIQTLKALVNLVCSYLKTPAAIWLAERGSSTLRIQAATGLTHEYITQAVFQVGDGSLAGQILKKGKLQIITDLSQEPRFFYQEERQAAGWVSMIACPIISRGQPQGLIQVFTLERYSFQPAELSMLQHLAKLASRVLEHPHYLHELRLLSRVAQTLRSTSSFDRAMTEIVRTARELSGADSSTIFLLNKRTNDFVVGAHTPDHNNELPKRLLQQIGSLTHQIIGQGDPIHIANALLDDRVTIEVVNEGVHSLIGVRIQMEEDPIGVLYVNGRHHQQFTERDAELLQTLANYVSVSLGWVRLLIEPSKVVEEATSNLGQLETILDEVCHQIQDVMQADFVAIQLIDPVNQVIETAHGIGAAEGWAGQAKHYLEPEQSLRDIQADIALTEHTEVIAGQDARYDPWIFDENRHMQYLRIFTPLIVYQNESGQVTTDWLQFSRCQFVQEEEDTSYRRSVHKLVMSEQRQTTQRHVKQVIGTVELGYLNRDRQVTDDDLQALVRLAGHSASQIYRGLLPHTFQAIVETARKIAHADAATLHIHFDPQRDRYVYQCGAGTIDDKFLDAHPRRLLELGQRAVRARQPLFIPDPARDADDALKELEPAIYAEGVRAIAAFPLIADDYSGVLHIYYHAPHLFSENKIEWVQLFAGKAVDAIRRATTAAQIRDWGRQLEILHSLGQSQNRIVGKIELLRYIAWSSLNVLAADVVVIYEYVEAEQRFLTPPTIAGRLIQQGAMDSQIYENDAPNLLIRAGKNVYAEHSPDSTILNSPKRQRTPDADTQFVTREKIQSSAGILLRAKTRIDAETEVVGVMFINYRRFHKFAYKECRLIETLASSAAETIRNHRVSDVLSIIEREIITTLDLEKLLKRIAQHGMQLTRADLGEIRLLDPVTSELVVQARMPDSVPLDPSVHRTKLGEGITGWVAANRRSALVTDVKKDPRYKVFSADTRAELCVPLLDRNEHVLGVLNMESRKVNAFDERDQHLLERLANQAVIAIQNAEQQKYLTAAQMTLTLGSLASSLLHYIYDEIGAIRVFAEDIRKSPQIPAEHMENVQFIEEISSRIIDETQSLKNWVQETPQPVFIQDVVHEAFELVTIPKDITVDVQFPPSLRPVHAGPYQLTHVFVNLLQNAVQAMVEGGIITIGGKNIDTSAQPWVGVWVRDTGSGITVDKREAIFRPNFGMRKDGLGFGLWWCRTYIEWLAGQLSVESEVGAWTQFNISLPSCTADEHLITHVIDW